MLVLVRCFFLSPQPPFFIWGHLVPPTPCWTTSPMQWNRPRSASFMPSMQVPFMVSWSEVTVDSQMLRDSWDLEYLYTLYVFFTNKCMVNVGVGISDTWSIWDMKIWKTEGMKGCYSGRFSMITSKSRSLNLIHLLGFDCFKGSMLNSFGMERKSDIPDVDLFGE